MPSNRLFQAKCFLLTYPQANIPNQNLLDFLVGLWPNATYCVVARELHADGSPHSHAVLCLSKRKDVYNVRHFDYNGFHPNVQAAQNRNAAITYVKKDGDFIEFHQDGSSSSESETNVFELARSMTEETYFTYCLDHRIPFNYANYAWARRNQLDEESILTILNDPNDELNMIFPQQLSMYHFNIL